MPVNQGKTMAVLAGVLHAEGIEVAGYRDSTESNSAHSQVVFHGDDEAGKMAVEIAVDHGFEPEGLVRDWVVVGKELGEGYWLLLL